MEPDHEVVVIGAGPGGICAGIRLKEAGVDDFLIIERGDDVGGSWRDNVYPGLTVDIPAMSYQFSFAHGKKWSGLFPARAEIYEYLHDVADGYGLRPHLRLGSAVVQETWSDAVGSWTLQLSDGSAVTARFVVSAVGGYINPKPYSGIPGSEDFEGKLLRPVEWDHSYDYRGKRVAVIGTGASSIQIVPALAPDVESIEVYQRTAQWVLPKPEFWPINPLVRFLSRRQAFTSWFDRLLHAGIDVFVFLLVHLPTALALRGVIALEAVVRVLYRLRLLAAVREREYRRELLPKQGFLLKRPTISNSFLQAFNRDDVTLITTPIDRITARGIRTVDGTERPVDVLVQATGYVMFSDPEAYPVGAVVGRGGLDLGERYTREGLAAYEGVAVPGFPNRWMVFGPNAWQLASWHRSLEITTEAITRVIVETRRRGQLVVELREKAYQQWRALLKSREVFNYYFTVRNAGVPTYVVNSQGAVGFLRPTTLAEGRRRSKTAPLDDYSYSTPTGIWDQPVAITSSA
ncbi:flavin-containing monooxygenase [Mycobacteroides salmoniphilum]|uniref:4-hydroxyacetophenone monooxygenase n=1 Tax=Mycobacteroides salmoniphilum TaxID=404941 RepID=A0A4R8SKE0_9MYCO|nr:NAD(P)/FAD-dependent oxidoreductase [Mycobacteroides salmoniphilum]TDZ97748.1 4-hydroxyacetophenone monooxygenase [Mycobacteroides salmoniphilum]TEA01978.1 4-hydroxyacetophenone monooxygenase [Mycobacteroides salmoniphilum]